MFFLLGRVEGGRGVVVLTKAFQPDKANLSKHIFQVRLKCTELLSKLRFDHLQLLTNILVSLASWRLLHHLTEQQSDGEDGVLLSHEVHGTKTPVSIFLHAMSVHVKHVITVFLCLQVMAGLLNRSRSSWLHHLPRRS